MEGFPRYGTEEKQWIGSVDPENLPNELLSLKEWSLASDVVAGGVVAGGSMALLAAAFASCAALLAF